MQPLIKLNVISAQAIFVSSAIAFRLSSGVDGFPVSGWPLPLSIPCLRALPTVPRSVLRDDRVLRRKLVPSLALASPAVADRMALRTYDLDDLLLVRRVSVDMIIFMTTLSLFPGVSAVYARYVVGLWQDSGLD